MLAPIFRGSGSTPARSLLKALADEDGVSMSDLAAKLGVQPPTVTKMISRLAAQDYVERRQSSGDGRQAHVFLTERGHERSR